MLFPEIPNTAVILHTSVHRHHRPGGHCSACAGNESRQNSRGDFESRQGRTRSTRSGRLSPALVPEMCLKSKCVCVGRQYDFPSVEAGRQLANKLKRYAGREDVIVLGIPRGGVPVAFEVTKALETPLDIFLSRKLDVPGQEELARCGQRTESFRTRTSIR